MKKLGPIFKGGGVRVAVYIDGSNFYGYLKDKEIGFPAGVKFDFTKFVQFLVGDRNCVAKRYYVGVARNFDNSARSKKIVGGQQKFLQHLSNEGFTIKRGRVMYDGGKIREKGTDVKMAVDLIVGAIDDYYDIAVLVSSDTDLVPAISYVKYRRKGLEYIGFSHAPSLGMQKYATLTKLLTKENIEQFKESTLL